MSTFIDVTGKRVGAWTVVAYTGRRLWTCRCDCGAVRDIVGTNLRNGVSLGCRSCRCGGHNRSHGETGTRLYRIWVHMIGRCENPDIPEYRWYGARGISVCPEWRASFVAFRDWALANGYAYPLTIDRERNDEGYSPGNCRWITSLAQARNRRSNRLLTWQGKTFTLSELAEKVGIRAHTIAKRLAHGWPLDRAVSEPPLR